VQRAILSDEVELLQRVSIIDKLVCCQKLHRLGVWRDKDCTTGLRTWAKD
jgi:hypothetical protein